MAATSIPTELPPKLDKDQDYSKFMIIKQLTEDPTLSNTKHNIIIGNFPYQSRVFKHIPEEKWNDPSYYIPIFKNIQYHFLLMDKWTSKVYERLQKPNYARTKARILNGEIPKTSGAYYGIPLSIFNTKDFFESLMNEVKTKLLDFNKNLGKKTTEGSNQIETLPSKFTEQEQAIINMLPEHPDFIDSLIRLKQSKDFNKMYSELKYKEEDKKLIQSLTEKLSINDLKEIINNRYKYKEIQKQKEINPDIEKEKIKKLKKLLNKAENELQRKKIQSQIDKLKETKRQKKTLLYINNLTEDEAKKLNLDKNPIVNPVRTSTIPNKFIPLFVKNKGVPGYHRITPDEIKVLKNDPSGDYYEGEGVRNKPFYPYGFKMDKNGFFHP